MNQASPLPLLLPLLLPLAFACVAEASPEKDGFVAGGKADAVCDYQWEGSERENACPESWLGTGDGCDCGCQVPDPDCGEVEPGVIEDTHVVMGLDAQYWIDADEAEFARNSVAPPFMTGAPPVPGEPEYAIVERLSPFLDAAFDHAVEILVAQNPGAEVNIPRPRLRIVPARSPNGWVAGLPVCLRTPIRVDAGRADRPTRETEQIILMADRLTDRMPGRPFGRPDEPCLDAEWGADVGAYVEFWNAQEGPCQLTYEDGELVVDGTECEYGGSATRSADVIVLATSPYVNLTSEMLVVAEDEDAIIGTLLHELGHYVLSHPLTMLGGGEYEKWYSQGETPSVERDVVPDSAEITADLERLEPSPKPRVPGQRYSHRLLRFLIDTVGGSLTDACTSGCVCDEAIAALEGSWTRDVTCFTCSSVSPETEAAYLAYEEALDACAAAIPVEAAPGAGAIEDADLRDGLSRYRLDELVDAPTEGTLADWLRAAQAGVEPLDREHDALLMSVETRNLGRYTAEQHADDFSLELFAAIGLDPIRRVDGMHALARVRHDEDPHAFLRGNGLTWAELDDLYLNAWKDREGNYVFIPLGDLHSMHHGMSYRVFNLSRELEAHGYVAEGEAPSVPHSWEEIRALAESLRDRVPPDREFTPMQPDPDDPDVVDGEPPLIID